MRDARLPASFLVAGRTEDVETAGLSLVEGDRGERRVRLVDQVADLRALCSHPERPLVYGVTEHPDGVSILVWDCATGEPVRVTAAVLPLAPDACDVAVSPDGGLLAIVSFGDDTGGAVVLVPLDHDGLPQLDVVHTLEGLTHPHQAVFVGDELLIPDLGADLVHRWTIRGTTAVPESPIAVPPGTGPRHMAGVGDGVDAAETAFVVSGELGQSVVRLDIADSGAPAQRLSTASTGSARSRSPRNYPGDIKRVRGDRAVVANRGYDTVALFETRGGRFRMLDEVVLEHSWPQHLLVGGDRILVACWDSSMIVELEIRDDDTLATIGEFSCPGASWLLEFPAAATPSRDLEGRRG